MALTQLTKNIKQSKEFSEVLELKSYMRKPSYKRAINCILILTVKKVLNYSSEDKFEVIVPLKTSMIYSINNKIEQLILKKQKSYVDFHTIIRQNFMEELVNMSEFLLKDFNDMSSREITEVIGYLNDMNNSLELLIVMGNKNKDSYSILN